MTQHPELQATDAGTSLTVHVQPGARRTEIVGRHGDALKIRVGAPPEGDRANDAVIELVAREFSLKAAAVHLVSGATNRQKRLELDGITPEAAAKVIDRLLALGTPSSPRR